LAVGGRAMATAPVTRIVNTTQVCAGGFFSGLFRSAVLAYKECPAKYFFPARRPDSVSLEGLRCGQRPDQGLQTYRTRTRYAKLIGPSWKGKIRKYRDLGFLEHHSVFGRGRPIRLRTKFEGERRLTTAGKYFRRSILNNGGSRLVIIEIGPTSTDAIGA